MARIGSSGKWFNILRRKLARSSSYKTTVIRRHSNASSTLDEPKTSDDETARYENLISEISSSPRKQITPEDKAAQKIQAIFRGHLARRAFRALRSLVKLQALARGAYVRRQSRIALHCMHALVRLQVRIRARQLLGKCSDE